MVQGTRADIQLQSRDLEVLGGLFEARIVTAQHVGQIFFGCKHAYAKKRLQRLKQAGLISGRRRNVNKPALLSVSDKGLELLSSSGHLDKYGRLGAEVLSRRSQVSDLTERHELGVMDVKAAFCASVEKNQDLSILEFTTWPKLNEFTVCVDSREILIKPDGFIRVANAIDGSGVQSFFLEYDRSTETQQTLVSRALCYLEYYRSGGFAAKCGAEPAAFRSFPFRLLFVLKSAERRNNIAERLLECTPPILTLVWLTTIGELLKDPLGWIWIRPLDYRRALESSGCVSHPQLKRGSYRSNPAREALVELRLTKQPLFGG